MDFPSVITVTLNKRSIIETVGIKLRQMQDRKIVISNLFGLALDTDLRVGHEILSVNGVPVMKTKHAADLIRKSCGRFTIVAAAPSSSTISTTEEEEDKCQKQDHESQSLVHISTVGINAPPTATKSLGVWFETTRDVLVRVARIADYSPFATTDLKVGDAILSINGVAVTSAAQAERLVSFPMGSVGVGVGGGVRTAKSVSIVSFSMERWRRALLLEHLNLSSSKAAVGSRVAKAKNYIVEAVVENNDAAPRRSCDEFRAERKDLKYAFRFRFDARSQRCELCEPWMYTETRPDVKSSYSRKAFRRIQPTLRAMNEAIERKMSELESAVVSNYVAADHVANSFVENLTHLGDMRERGLLDEIEFSAAKAQLLGLYEQSTLIGEAIPALPSQVVDERIPSAIVHTVETSRTLVGKV